MYTRFYVYVNNAEYSEQAKNKVCYNPHYNGKDILDRLPEGARVSKTIEIGCFGLPSYGYSFYVKDS